MLELEGGESSELLEPPFEIETRQVEDEVGAPREPRRGRTGGGDVVDLLPRGAVDLLGLLHRHDA